MATETAISDELKSESADTLDKCDEKYGALFSGSIYRELIYFGHTKSINGLTLSIFILFSQVFIYSRFVSEGVSNIAKSSVNVSIPITDCQELEGEIDASGDWALECEATFLTGFEDFLAVLLPTLLLSVFIFGDIISCIKVLLVVKGIWSKISAILILSMEFYAIYVAGLFAYQAAFTGSLFDAIVNCVGVLFIHDMDEKIYEAFDYIDSKYLPCCFKKECCSKNAPVILFLIWIVIVYILITIINQVTESE